MSAPPGRIALLGLRGAGKSSVGRALAERLGWPFVDLDQHLAVGASSPGEPRTAGELLRTLGEPGFRELESRSLVEVLARPAPLVLATGGGVVVRPENRRLLAEGCFCVWLEAEPEVLLQRIQAEQGTRPPLTDLEPLEELRCLAEQRAVHYSELAQLRLDVAEIEIDSLASVIAARISD